MARRKILSVALATLMTLSTTMGQSNLYGIVPVAHASGQSKEVTVDATQVSGEDYGLRDDIQEGVILHCFDWKYSDIKAELPNIAAAGFTAVQTSPAQKGDGDVWYWLYQPQTFSIQGNALGGKNELTELCAEAEKYDIKVIVDVVANHTRSKNDDGMDSSWFHDLEGEITYDADHRWQIIKGKIGMPDLASEQERVQTKVKGYIEELKSVGVDGIRWDAAKHIGLPSEDCNFWPAVTGLGLYNYGEILNGPCNNSGNNDALMKEYTNYLTVTDDEYGDGVLKSIASGSIPTSIGNYCQRGVSKDKLIYWAESHDTYSNNGEYGKATQNISEDKINRTYALLASQGQATALYFSRPKEKDKHQIKAGVKGDAENFKSKQIAAVNHLHNHCVGEKEYYATGNDAAAVCRETGACIVKASGSGQVTVQNGGGLTAPGTYTDEVSGNTFEVTATTISGEVGESGIAVIYSDTASTKKASVSASLADGSSFTDETVNVTLTVKNASSATYSVDGGAETTISGTANVTVGAGLSAGQKTTITVKMTSEDGETSSKTFTYTKKEAGTVEANTIYATKPSGWSGMYIYIYKPGDEVKKLTGEWPGVAMTDAGDGVYTYQLSSDVTSAKVIFNDGNGKQNPEDVPGQACGFDFTGGKAYTFDGSWAEATIQQPATAAPVQTSAPVVSDPVATVAPTQQVAPTENGGNVSTPTIRVSQAEGTEFKTETLDVKVTLSGVTQGSYSVDNGPEKTFTNSATVTLGQGLIGDKETTLKVNAGNVTKTFTYKKVFDASTSVVKSSAISRIQSIAEIIADLVQVNADAISTGIYGTNPSKQVGTCKTISSMSDFNESDKIACAGAWDVANRWKGGHENSVADCYGLYAAYDDSNLYIGVEYVNTTDTWANAGDGPLSDGGKMVDIPVILALNTGKGNAMTGKCPTDKAGHPW
ncbi:MAG: starch-binding protein, partial [Lachnospiraceae bacterium]|nr:starch-binding protein [Lachnospiraceae bacterium]